MALATGPSSLTPGGRTSSGAGGDESMSPRGVVDAGVDDVAEVLSDVSSPRGVDDVVRSGTLRLSSRPGEDGSLTAADDVAQDLKDVCQWCRRQLLRTTQVRWCSKRCRQAAWRQRKRHHAWKTSGAGLPPGARFAYADPPYPGLSRKYYGDEPDYGGEVDHERLIASLVAGGYTGWALSTSAKSLRDVLSLCPPHARVCPWVKPRGVPRDHEGPFNSWEPLIVVGGRRLQPGFRDYLRAQPARHEPGDRRLMGRKSQRFCAFLFQQLGMVPGDVLDDLFPGTGIVSRAWGEICRVGTGTTSFVPGRDDVVRSRTLQLSARSSETSSPPGGDT